jgi:hypothetical protein
LNNSQFEKIREEVFAFLESGAVDYKELVKRLSSSEENSIAALRMMLDEGELKMADDGMVKNNSRIESRG